MSGGCYIYFNQHRKHRNIMSAAHTGKFVAYYRVSTQRQGRSGLGLEAQRTAVQDYLNGGDWRLVAEVTEVESGKRSDRPKLAEALTLCRLHGATLIIAKLDRLARNVGRLRALRDYLGFMLGDRGQDVDRELVRHRHAFISNLMESGVEFHAVDMRLAAASVAG
jgi:DNA invertase Pin-like site-specific DNA recombinase